MFRSAALGGLAARAFILAGTGQAGLKGDLRPLFVAAPPAHASVRAFQLSRRRR